ncbi:MAG: signal peptidase I [Firmicutes bacterium]|nr:signal peptidase I [Bacillota bacterium]
MYFGNLPDDTDDKSIIAAGEEAAADTAEDTGKGEKQSVPAVIWTYLKVLLVALLLAFFLRAYVFDITQVQGLSMYDTLNDGDMLVTSRISYILGEPQRGDIVVLNAPDSPGEDYVKRVIAMPNEQLDIEGGLVYIDGKLLPENYLDGVFTDGDIHMVIPDGYYFVMGDNRGVSRDSREESVGVISGDNIHGKAVFRFWPFKTIGGLK